MPIYEYVCARCGNRFEVFQKVTDPPLQKCRTCAGPLKKVISPPAIQFKGNGWYITDYARRAPSDKDAKTPAPPTNQESSPGKKSTEADKPSPAKG